MKYLNQNYENYFPEYICGFKRQYFQGIFNQGAYYILNIENEKCKKLIIEVSFNKLDYSNKNSIGKLWIKNKYLKEKIPNYYSVKTYAHLKNGLCMGIYNPYLKGNKINFDYVKPAEKENLYKLLSKVRNMYLYNIERI